ncbi:hypothetical protein JCM5353_005751 [Sporobolomyces roseus]
MPSPPSTSSGSDDEGLGAFLQEPDDFRPPTPPPTVRTYQRRKLGGVGEIIGEQQVQVGLVSGHPLWGHILYPAAIALAQFLELHAATLLHGQDGVKGKGRGKNVLELGAGGGLPGLVAAMEGAGQVVISDFPDAALVKNLEKNIEENANSLLPNTEIAETRAAGFTWGSSPASLFPPSSSSSSDPSKFDLILLSDLVFNHSQHLALLRTCLSCLSTSPSPSASPSVPSPPNLPSTDLTRAGQVSTPAVLCFYSHHRPWLVKEDEGILSLARDNGWKVDKVWQDEKAGPAFPEDDGDLAIRSTVHGWMFTRAT